MVSKGKKPASWGKTKKGQAYPKFNKPVTLSSNTPGMSLNSLSGHPDNQRRQSGNLGNDECVRCGNKDLTDFDSQHASAFCNRCGARTWTKKGYLKEFGQDLETTLKKEKDPLRHYLVVGMRLRGYSDKAANEYADALAPFYSPEEKAESIFDKLSTAAKRDLIEKTQNYTGVSVSLYGTPQSWRDLGPNGKSAIQHYLRHRGYLPLEL